MSKPESAPARWNWQRWTWIGGLGVLAHAGLIFWLGERTEPAQAVGRPEPLLHLAARPASGERLGRTSLPADPTLFALPSYDGFSGRAWLALQPPEPPPEKREEMPQSLPLATNELGAVFMDFLAANRRNGSVMEDILKPRTTTADVLLLNDSRMTQSVVRIEGPLADRRLAVPLRAPEPAYADVVPDTVIQLKVTADGLTESALVLASCGVETLDRQALELATAARFVPLTAEEGNVPGAVAQPVTWGRIVVQWFTLPPSATNVTAANLP